MGRSLISVPKGSSISSAINSILIRIKNRNKIVQMVRLEEKGREEKNKGEGKKKNDPTGMEEKGKICGRRRKK